MCGKYLLHGMMPLKISFSLKLLLGYEGAGVEAGRRYRSDFQG